MHVGTLRNDSLGNPKRANPNSDKNNRDHAVPTTSLFLHFSVQVNRPLRVLYPSFLNSFFSTIPLHIHFVDFQPSLPRFIYYARSQHLITFVAFHFVYRRSRHTSRIISGVYYENSLWLPKPASELLHTPHSGP
ncbi:uncharacterized protein LY79DRAFT_173359 [Colletotrichum navitas]|uniref:Uncharacterized protein n=1 Tax=Colletotrichum navitas TaxID=681940 RepID=A0AAD8Q1P7_9PEZI|nr:uncharacterized protein LY79DRAFT_173359 [Colletotrichum navitas]KAK1593890.1 hypothetical protein LY79DRAFT_173359 [Colletotrichum navitas]